MPRGQEMCSLPHAHLHKPPTLLLSFLSPFMLLLPKCGGERPQLCRGLPDPDPALPSPRAWGSFPLGADADVVALSSQGIGPFFLHSVLF